MFNFQAFNTELKRDNPTYGRYVKSDLHALVTLLSRGGFTAKQVAAEMKRISPAKWGKYAGTRKYLIAQMPTLAGRLANFRTQSMVALPGGNIKHDAIWDSDTGIKVDLDHISVREKVSWGVASVEAAPFLDPAYRVQGQHYGLGNGVFSVGSVGNMSDTHDATGAWGPSIFNFAGPHSISYTVAQVYQYSDDNRATWNDIPNSTYEIVRTALAVGDKIRMEIVKRSVAPSTLHESASNFRLA
jgi:hypothetical protein